MAERGSILPGFGYSAIVVRKDLVDSGLLRDFPDFKGLRVAIGAPAKGAGPLGAVTHRPRTGRAAVG